MGQYFFWISTLEKPIALTARAARPEGISTCEPAAMIASVHKVPRSNNIRRYIGPKIYKCSGVVGTLPSRAEREDRTTCAVPAPLTALGPVANASAGARCGGESLDGQVQSPEWLCRSYNAAVNAADIEFAYMFRHALVRDTAYELQLPGDRARLHELAFHALESFHGLGAASPGSSTVVAPVLDRSDAAAELALHARLGSEVNPALAASELKYLRLAALQCAAKHQFVDAAAYAEAVARHAQQTPELRRRAWAMAAGYLDSAGQAGNAFALLQLADSLPGPGADNPDEFSVASIMGRVYMHCGYLGAAESNNNYALQIARNSRNRNQELTALSALANTLMQQQRTTEADQVFSAAIRLARDLGDLRELGVLFSNHGVLLGVVGRHIERREAYEQALQLHRQTGNRRFEAVTMGNLAELMWAEGRPEEALAQHRASLVIHRELGHRRFEGVSLCMIGRVLTELNRIEEAEGFLREAIEICREGADLRMLGVALASLAWILGTTGRVAAGEAMFGEAFRILKPLPDSFLLGDAMADYGLFLLAVGRVEEGCSAWQEGAALCLEARGASALNQILPQMERACKAAGVPPFPVPAALRPKETAIRFESAPY